jgi:hypothetical protein
MHQSIEVEVRGGYYRYFCIDIFEPHIVKAKLSNAHSHISLDLI